MQIFSVSDISFLHKISSVKLGKTGRMGVNIFQFILVLIKLRIFNYLSWKGDSN